MNMNVLMQNLTLRTCQTLQLCKPDPGSDVIYAGAGNDHVWGEGGNDVIFGEGG